MAKRDYYEVLEVTKTVTTDELKVSYRKLAMRYHPDRNPGNAEAEARFKEATEAFEILTDPERRARYDRYGHDAVSGVGGGGGGPGMQVDLGDLLGDLFGGFFGQQGGGRRRAGPQPGRDVQIILDIDLAEAARGVTKKVTVQREDHCGTCNGSGAKAGTKVGVCKRCNGQGEVVVQQMIIAMRQTCRACEGTGKSIPDPCGSCRGSGKSVGRQEIEVNIPPGVDTGDRIRKPDQGDVGDAGAPRGNLEFAIRVKEHKFFQRDGQHLICQWPITFAQAALGGPIEITTLVGEKVRYDLPRGLQTHEVLRLAGHGMPGRRGSRNGDLLVQVVVDTPQKLSPEQEAIYRKLAELDKLDVGAPEKKSFFSKLKDLFGTDEK
jgi:molecular chaperone DnaJ